MKLQWRGVGKRCLVCLKKKRRYYLRDKQNSGCMVFPRGLRDGLFPVSGIRRDSITQHPLHSYMYTSYICARLGIPNVRASYPARIHPRSIFLTYFRLVSPHLGSDSIPNSGRGLGSTVALSFRLVNFTSYSIFAATAFLPRHNAR